MSRLRVACVTVMLLAAPAGVSGQSLFARGGLGVPVEPIGARAKGMASLGIGLFGSSLSPVDPAAGLEVPSSPPGATGRPPTNRGTCRVSGFPSWERATPPERAAWCR
jgi:hypothetical protein